MSRLSPDRSLCRTSHWLMYMFRRSSHWISVPLITSPCLVHTVTRLFYRDRKKSSITSGMVPRTVQRGASTWLLDPIANIKLGTPHTTMSGKQYQCKMVIIGDSTVGKTSILNRYVKGTLDLTLQSTIGVSFFHKNITIDNNTYKLEIYDTAGQERFNSLVPMYYQRAHFCFIVFDLTNAQSFQRVAFWEGELKKNTNSDGKVIQRVVIGNKCDRVSEIAVDEHDVRRWCQENQLHYYRCSALTGDGINEMFSDILKKYSWQEVEEGAKIGQANTAGRDGTRKGCC